MRVSKFAVVALAVAVVLGLNHLAGRAQDTKDEKGKLKVEIEVPYVPTKEPVVTAMLKLAGVKEGDTVYDLGCGDGRIVIAAVKDFKAKRGLGIDFNPERLKDCAESVKKAKLTAEQEKALTFKQGDVLKMTPEDFKDVDVVTLYLLPEVNLKLRPILEKGLKPGARIVSHDFDMGDWKPDKEEKVVVDREHTIYLWTIKPKK
jgi:SAM-dependent methyltransferase